MSDALKPRRTVRQEVVVRTVKSGVGCRVELEMYIYESLQSEVWGAGFAMFIG